MENMNRLSKCKLEIEKEMDEIYVELTTGLNPPGIQGPLIDAEGFPRADVDVYNVRLKRHRLACLKNDYKQVMREIDEELILIHSKTKSTRAKEEHKAYNEHKQDVIQQDSFASETSVRVEPFAQIKSVAEGSPSEMGNLQVGDFIVEFGTANVTNHRDLKAISDVVLNNLGQEIKVVVLRNTVDSTPVKLKLLVVPKQWSGPGYLGCHFVPL